MKKVIYPGTFDPVTLGHIDIIKRAASVFDEVTVSILKNPDKQTFFPLSDRMAMLKESLEFLGKKVEVDSFDGLLVNYAREKKINAVIRGLRAVTDFEYEFQMALTNKKIYPQAETFFIMTDESYSYLSSSVVKDLYRFGADISEFVPPSVIKYFKKHKG